MKRLLAIAFVGCAGTGAPSEPPTLNVLLGNGDGTFRDGGDYAAHNPVAIATGDFDGDGIGDVAVANVRGVSVLPGVGGGQLGDARDVLSLAGGALTLVAADFDGDGIADLAVGGESGVELLLGGSHGFRHTHYISGETTTIVAADFDHDGAIDLALGRLDRPRAFTMRNHGDGTFEQPFELTTNLMVMAMAAADVDGDGNPDLALAGFQDDDPNAPTFQVATLIGNGDGSLHASHALGTGGVDDIVVGDFDRDGRVDLALAGGGSELLLGDGTGVWRPKDYLPLAPVVYVPCCLAVGDFNGDQRADLATLSGHSLQVMLGRGDATFDAAASYEVTYSGALADALARADLDGDGIDDLVVAAGNVQY